MSRVYKWQLIVVYSKIGNRFFLSDSSHSSPPPLFLLVARQCDLPRPKLKFESQEYIIHVFDYIKDCYFEIFHRRVNCSILSATTHFLTQALHKRLNLLRLSYSFLLPQFLPKRDKFRSLQNSRIISKNSSISFAR